MSVARGTDQCNTEQGLYLFRTNKAGMQWLAVHGPPGAPYEDVATAVLVFGSAENIVMPGNHEWHWHPCMF